MTNDHLKQFLDLPDWKKVELKLTQSKFNSYPIQTEEQEYNRRIAIFQICAHFSMQDIVVFLDNIAQTTLDGLWCTAMELFITPKLLDFFDMSLFGKFGICYYCEEFQGYNKMDYRIRNPKIHTLYGICKHAKYSNISKSLMRVLPKQRCISWNPLKMIEQLIDLKIKKSFDLSDSMYYYDDYIKDLNTIDIWDYFQNRYKSRG